ncbi:MAG: hypothetical protein Nkreftii_002657 [Candidatus Nitrospira kreftii]|uniref:Uncharacterized protein n=1 Tax=Candidatus Nitrospira kreftii TaxID=2652173 RepID=A0A7S8FFJ7_9BACT|nr:MAG: hypothetical protein Nkreftii_002657 [Candidatus Nitrospira kreftii]
MIVAIGSGGADDYLYLVMQSRGSLCNDVLSESQPSESWNRRLNCGPRPGRAAQLTLPVQATGSLKKFPLQFELPL